MMKIEDKVMVVFNLKHTNLEFQGFGDCIPLILILISFLISEIGVFRIFVVGFNKEFCFDSYGCRVQQWVES